MHRSFALNCFVLFCFCCISGIAYGQDKTDTLPDSIDPELLNLMNTKVPKEYTLGGIKVTGTKRYDEQLLLSISGLSVGDKLLIPGGDNISKAITNLWNQRLFSNIQIFYTRLEAGNTLFLEIRVFERPALSKYFLKGVRKTDDDELRGKTGLVVGRVVTEIGRAHV